LKILICNKCIKSLKETNHLDLCSTWRSIIFGCIHSIAELDKDVMDEVSRNKRELAVVVPAHIPLDKLVSIVGKTILKFNGKEK